MQPLVDASDEALVPGKQVYLAVFQRRVYFTSRAGCYHRAKEFC
jgi:hypothetical protein